MRSEHLWKVSRVWNCEFNRSWRWPGSVLWRYGMCTTEWCCKSKLSFTAVSEWCLEWLYNKILYRVQYVLRISSALCNSSYRVLLPSKGNSFSNKGNRCRIGDDIHRRCLHRLSLNHINTKTEYGFWNWPSTGGSPLTLPSPQAGDFNHLIRSCDCSDILVPGWWAESRKSKWIKSEWKRKEKRVKNKVLIKTIPMLFWHTMCCSIT